MRFFRCLIIMLALSCQSLIAYEALFNAEVLDYADKYLPSSGALKSTGKFIYVDLDDAYIHQLNAFIQAKGFEEPPYFGPGLVGAHISVVYPEEIAEIGNLEMEEFGKAISFVLKDCKVVHPRKMKAVDSVYMIMVEAPELERIRTKYGLPKLEYGFHITIGVKRKAEPAA